MRSSPTTRCALLTGRSVNKWKAMVAMDPADNFYADYWIRTVRLRRMDKQPLDCVQELVDAVAPPGAPGSRDWSEVEHGFGTRLPSDYKKIVDLYGPGDFLGLRLHVPAGPSEEFDLGALVDKVQNRAAAYRAEVRPQVAAPYFPQVGGLIPWGENTDGEVHFWCPAG